MTLAEVIEKLDSFRRRGTNFQLFVRRPWTSGSECDVLVLPDGVSEKEAVRETERLEKRGLEWLCYGEDVQSSIDYLASEGIVDPVPEEVCEAILDQEQME